MWYLAHEKPSAHESYRLSQHARVTVGLIALVCAGFYKLQKALFGIFNFKENPDDFYWSVIVPLRVRSISVYGGCVCACVRMCACACPQTVYKRCVDIFQLVIVVYNVVYEHHKRSPTITRFFKTFITEKTINTG